MSQSNCSAAGLPETKATEGGVKAETQESTLPVLSAPGALEPQTPAQLLAHLPEGGEGGGKNKPAPIELAVATAAVSSTNKSTLKYARGPFLVDGIDITKCPSQFKGIAKVPDANKRSIWWRAFHVVQQEGENGNKPCALCNLCCKILSRGNSASTSSMKKHISHCHPKIYPSLLALEGSQTASNTTASKQSQHGASSAPRPQVKVSFVSNTNDIDNDDHRKRSTAKNGKTTGTKGSSSSSSTSSRPRFMIRMVGNVDITKCPEEYKDRATAPAPNKRSIWWNSFHEIKDGDDGNVCALCNLCSKILSMGNSASTSCMRRHMMHCHPDVYPILLELENKTNSLAAAEKNNALESSSSSATSGVKRVRDMNDGGIVAGDDVNEARANKKRKRMQAETRATMNQQFLNHLSLYSAYSNRPFVSDYDETQFRQVIEAAVRHGQGLRMAGLSDYEHPSADSIQVNLHELAEQAKNKLKVRLQGKKLTATTDHWISRARLNYVSLTVHWIEDFALYSAVLAVYMFKGVSVLDLLLEDFDSKLDEWGISKSVPYVVTDTEDKMNKFGEMVYEQLGIEQINCIDYSLQLVSEIAFNAVLNTDDKDLEECYDELSDFDDEDVEDNDGSYDKDEDDGALNEDKKQKATDTKYTLRKCRAIVVYFSRSTESTNQLKKLQDDRLFDDVDESKRPLELILDIVPRWWSTLAMIDRLLILKGPLGVYESIYGFQQRCRGKKRGKKQVPIEMPSKQEWETLETLHKLLKPLEAAQKILEGSKYVTSSLVLYIVHVIHGELVAISELTGQANEKIRTAATKMIETFEQQFGSDLGDPFTPKVKRKVGNKHVGLHKVFIFAHALDPRFKSLAAIATKENQQAIWDALHKEMVALGPPKQGGNAPSSSKDAQVDAADMKEDPDEKSSWASGSKFDAYAAAQPNEPEAADQDKWRLQCKTEIMAYEREPGLGLTKKNENPLLWWKEYALSYPTLWRLAEIYLAAPATAANPDRAFSVDCNMVTMRRCQSKTDTTEDCHFLHENAWILDDE